MSKALAVRLQAMLGEDAGVGWSEVMGTEGLYPKELNPVARAVPDRQAEFAAGRRAARAALAELGHPPEAILRGPDRNPLWPEGIAGAITHDAGLAMAAVVKRDSHAGVGIDLTEAAPLPAETRRTILPHEEEAGLDEIAARAGFSAKETLFKAIFPIANGFFGFSAAVVRPDLAAGTIQIALSEKVGPFEPGAHWTARVVRLQNRLLTALRL